ncbi:MAG: ketol-acid reductoisomerase, partial [Granulosicoccaceae bacterium]
CYLFDQAARPLLAEKFMPKIKTDVIGGGLQLPDNGVDNAQLIAVNGALRNHSVEIIGEELRGYMTDMKAIV